MASGGVGAALANNAATSRLDASALRNAQDLYRTTKIWHAHLSFTPEQWKALEFKRIGPMPNFARPEGLWFLRNPQARRSGIVGVLGFEFDWTHASFEFGGVAFTNVAARVKGNVRSLYEPTRAYKFGFIPWDLDSAWGNIWIASRADSIQASIWHPWIGENRFLERVMAGEEFRRIYRAHLEDFVERLYVPDRLHRRIDEIAAVIRDPIAAQSALRLDKFEQEVGLKLVHPSPGEVPNSFNRPANELKRFIDQRAESVRRQLDGKSKGMILKYPEQK